MDRLSGIDIVRTRLIEVRDMTLERVVAAPFKRAGSTSLSEQEFVVGLSLHRDWFSPAQAKRVIELGVADGLLSREDSTVSPAFDPATITIPPEYTPDTSILTRRSPFEAMLERLVDDGVDKRTAVGEINRLQESLDVTIDADAAIYAARRGVDVRSEAKAAAESIRAGER